MILFLKIIRIGFILVIITNIVSLAYRCDKAEQIIKKQDKLIANVYDESITLCDKYKDIIMFHSSYTNEEKIKLLEELNKTIIYYRNQRNTILIKGE